MKRLSTGEEILKCRICGRATLNPVCSQCAMVTLRIRDFCQHEQGRAIMREELDRFEKQRLPGPAQVDEESFW